MHAVYRWYRADKSPDKVNSRLEKQREVLKSKGLRNNE